MGKSTPRRQSTTSFAEALEHAKTNPTKEQSVKQTKKAGAPAATDKLVFDLDADLGGTHTDAPDTGAEEARRQQMDERSSTFNSVLYALPGSVAQIVWSQRSDRLAIASQLATRGTATEKDMLRARRDKLDADSALQRRFNASFGQFTPDEAPVISRHAKFAYVTAIALLCPSNWFDLGHVADRAIALGVARPVTDGNTRKVGVVKVGRDRWIEMSPEFKATAADMRTTWPKDLVVKGVAVPAYKNPFEVLGDLASALAREASQRWRDSLDALNEGLTPNLNAIGVADKGGEGDLVVTDPGDDQYDGGKVRVTAADGKVTFVAGHGNSYFRNKITQIAEAGITVAIADLGLTPKQASTTYKGTAFAAFMIASRAFKHERVLIERANAEREAAEHALTEVTTIAKKAAGKGKKLISAADFHGGATGVAVLVVSEFEPTLPVYKDGEIVRDGTRTKTTVAKLGTVPMAVERVVGEDNKPRIIIHGVAACHAVLLAEIPAGSSFYELDPDDKTGKRYSGVNNPARFFLRCNLGATEKQQQAAAAATETEGDDVGEQTRSASA
ncbi:MAG: hypothetical protein HY455_02685 [Parcubacteria group bacterium]|nr:hypothetical protein [Parcubacteria group bacterium]